MQFYYTNMCECHLWSLCQNVKSWSRLNVWISCKNPTWPNEYSSLPNWSFMYVHATVLPHHLNKFCTSRAKLFVCFLSQFLSYFDVFQSISFRFIRIFFYGFWGGLKSGTSPHYVSGYWLPATEAKSKHDNIILLFSPSKIKHKSSLYFLSLKSKQDQAGTSCTKLTSGLQGFFRPQSSSVLDPRS